MKILLLGDENLTFTSGFLNSFPEDEVEVACCLAEDQLKDEIKPSLQILRDRGTPFHFSVNPAQLKASFSDEGFDRLVYILPGLAFHGCPDFIDYQSEMFRLRLHLFCFGFLKSAKSSVKVDGEVWFLWPDMEDSTGFAHIEPDKLGKFCFIKRSKADDAPFDVSQYNEWKPLIHGIAKPSPPEWLTDSKYYVFKMDQDSKSDTSAGTKLKGRKRKGSSPASKKTADAQDENAVKPEKESEEVVAESPPPEEAEQHERFDDFNVLKIPPQVFQLDRVQLPHVNECFYFKLWGKNSLSIQVSKLTLKYDPRISGWKGDGSSGRAGGRDGMKDSKGRGNRPYRGGRGMKGDMMMRPPHPGGMGGPGGMPPPPGYFNFYGNNSMPPPHSREGMGGMGFDGPIGYGPPGMMGGGFFGPPPMLGGPAPRGLMPGFPPPHMGPMLPPQSGQPPSSALNRIPGNPEEFRMMPGGDPSPRRGQLPPKSAAAGGARPFNGPPLAGGASNAKQGNAGNQNIGGGRPVPPATNGGRYAPLKRGSDQVDSTQKKRIRGSLPQADAAPPSGEFPHGGIGAGKGKFSVRNGSPDTSRQQMYVGEGYDGYGVGGQGAMELSYANGGGYVDGYGVYAEGGYEYYGNPEYEKVAGYEGYNGYDGYGPGEYGGALTGGNAGYDGVNYYGPGGYVGELGDEYFGYGPEYGPGYGGASTAGYYEGGKYAGAAVSGMTEGAPPRSGQYPPVYEYNQASGYDAQYVADYKGGGAALGTAPAYVEDYGPHEVPRSNPRMYDSYYGEPYPPQGNVLSTGVPIDSKSSAAATSAQSYGSSSYSQYGRY